MGTVAGEKTVTSCVLLAASPTVVMSDSHTYPEKGTLAVAIVLGSIGLLLGAGEPVLAQDRGRTAPSVRSAPSQQGPEPAAQRNGGPLGTELPAATRPADPPSSLGRPPSGATPTGGGAQTSDGPDMPDSPPQAPIGGAEWLAAAGAAYALNRLRKRESADESDEG